MCLNPLHRPNPNLGCNPKAGLMFMKDTTSKFIEVPCGHCPECVALKQNQLTQRVENESKYSYLYFCTLTYDNKHLPCYRVLVPSFGRTEESCSTSRCNLVPVEPFPSLFEDASLGVSESSSSNNFPRPANVQSITPEDCERFLADESFAIPDHDPFLTVSEDMENVDDTDIYSAIDYKEVFMPYADIHHIQLLLKNLRDNNPVEGRYLRYIAVSELGKRRARPHFHILFFVEKLPSDDKFTPLRLEKPLRDYVKSHWAVNIGTRKNPVWEPRFTYRRCYRGGKLYQNFDLHYVDPKVTTEGVLNVAYYVTKYMMKPSAKEMARQQFLKLNLDETQYNTTWNRIKCRLLISKGLGLDVRFETIEQTEYVPLPLDQYAKVLDADDLPPDFRPDATPVVRKKRVMIPNFELAQWIHDTMVRGLNESNPHPIYVDLNGKHRPLARYYQDKFYIYTSIDALDFWFNATPDQVTPPPYNPHKIKSLEYAHKKRLEAVDSKGDFDHLSSSLDTLLFDSLPDSGDTLCRRPYYSNSNVYHLGTDSL